MTIDYLKNWCINNNAINRTKEMFWDCFDSYSKEEYEEFKSVFTNGKNDVQIRLDKVSYVLELPDFDNELISITMDIYVCERPIGWYKQLFMLNGETFDVYFVIE